MLCEKCKKNEACYHSTLIVNGNSKTTNLCYECATKEDLIQKNSVDIFNDFFSSFNDMFEDSLNEFFCPSCNISLGDFRRNHFLGCPSCYDIFKDDLSILEQRIKDDEKIEFNTPKTSSIDIQIEDLQKKMKKAIEEERYEDAGDYKKQIENLKNRQN